MSEISRTEYRAVIKFLTLEKQLPNNIYERLVNVYGDSAPSYSTVTRSVAEFKCGQSSLEDDTQAWHGQLKWSLMIVAMLVMDNRRLTVLELPTEVGISYGSDLYILHEHLDLSKVCARWVPRLLTPVQKSFGWKHVQSCWLSTVQPRTTCCPV